MLFDLGFIFYLIELIYGFLKIVPLIASVRFFLRIYLFG